MTDKHISRRTVLKASVAIGATTVFAQPLKRRAACAGSDHAGLDRRCKERG